MIAMAGRSRTCPTPHPLRTYDNRGDWQWDATLEHVGGYEDSSWMRCQACGAWFWVVCDSGRFAYQNDWRLPAEQAERALRGHEPGPIVALLVGQNLPHGPLWEQSSARVELLRHMTPGHTDRERIAALQAQAQLDREWSDALVQLIDDDAATRRSVRVPPLEFVIDLRRNMAGCDEVFELPGSVIAPLPDRARLLRFNETGGVEIPLPGRPRLLARQDDSLLFMIEGASPSLRLLRPETMLGLPLPDGTQPLALALDRGHYLLIVDPVPTAAGACRVEVRNASLEFVASLPVIVESRSPYPTSPRAMADGWLFSNVVDDAGARIGLCLFDERWQAVARSDDPGGSDGSEGILGTRSFDVIDERRVLAVPLSGPSMLEGWAREDARLVRIFAIACHTHVRIGERIVGSEGGELFGCDLAGTTSWRRRIEVLNVQLIALGAGCVLVVGDRLLALIDPDTGESISQLEGAIDDLVLVDQSGAAHLMFGATLLSCSPSGAIERTPLDGEYELVGTAGIGVIAQHVHDRTRHLWIACNGEPLAEFEAGDPRWSVIGSAAGPHVLEPERLRIHRLPAGVSIGGGG
jgi:hypothetical protein